MIAFGKYGDDHFIHYVTSIHYIYSLLVGYPDYSYSGVCWGPYYREGVTVQGFVLEYRP